MSDVEAILSIVLQVISITAAILALFGVSFAG